MTGYYISEQLVAIALGNYMDPNYRTDRYESSVERAGISAMTAGLALHGDFDTLKTVGFNPWKTGEVVLKLADDIIGK